MKNETGDGAISPPIWTVRNPSGDELREREAADWAEHLHVSPVLAKVLIGRGWTDWKQAQAFLDSSTMVWHDPMLMADMAPAVRRILQAVERGETIAVYGDYDVDGVTSVSVLYLYLRAIGAQTLYYIPGRTQEGYGVSVKALDDLRQRGVSFLITVDTGITAFEEIRYATELGMEVVVTDHHECQGTLPQCCAVVNPHRPDCSYPFQELAGVGVVFKVICACEMQRSGHGTPGDPLWVGEELIDLVALGTIADVMPMTDENRWMVQRGLSRLERHGRHGLNALLCAMEGHGRGGGQKGASQRKITANTVGYGLAPRLNAAGRMTHASEAVALLLADSAEEAARQAEHLCGINARRQAEEARMAEQAYGRVDAWPAYAAARSGGKIGMLVLEDDVWPQGIIGIVASRVMERYGWPTVLISFEGNVKGQPSGEDIGKGSGRSVPGLNLVQALEDSRDLLVGFGGHELAAGLSIRRKDIPAFREKINEYVATHVTPQQAAPRRLADCQVRLSELTLELAQEIDRMEPFGEKNPMPLFMVCDVTLAQIAPIGGGKHTRMTVTESGCTMTAVWFGRSVASLMLQEGESLDLLVHLNVNEYRGRRTLQLLIQDARPSAVYARKRQELYRRYEEILKGDPIGVDERATVIPNREDVARVYTLLRDDVRRGVHTCTERALLRRLGSGASNDGGTGYGSEMSLIKVRCILRILAELMLCTVEQATLRDGEVLWLYDVVLSAPKTSIEASEFLHQLRRQCAADTSQQR